MSRKSSWWLRPQKKGASNRAALEEAKLFREANRKSLGRIKELEAENAKLRELLTFYLGCLTNGHVNCESCALSGEDDCDHGRMVTKWARELGIEVYG